MFVLSTEVKFLLSPHSKMVQFQLRTLFEAYIFGFYSERSKQDFEGGTKRLMCPFMEW